MKKAGILIAGLLCFAVGQAFSGTFEDHRSPRGGPPPGWGFSPKKEIRILPQPEFAKPAARAGAANSAGLGFYCRAR